MSRLPTALFLNAAAHGVVLRRSSASCAGQCGLTAVCSATTTPASITAAVAFRMHSSSSFTPSSPQTAVPKRVVRRAEAVHADRTHLAEPLPATTVKVPTTTTTTSGKAVGIDPPVRHASMSAAAQPLAIPTPTLAPPESMTHEHLAYAHCPICRLYLHVCDMYLHLTSRHKELNPKHCQRMCTERLAVYRRVIGVDLVKDASGGSSGSSMHGVDVNPAAGWDRFLPTLLDGGGYICNWCERRDVVHATRDQFLKHVTRVHAHLDLDLVEERVPMASPQTVGARPPVAPAAAPRRRLTSVVQAKAESAIVLPPPPSTLPPPTPTAAAVSSVGAADTFACELCGKSYGSETFLLQHFQTVHPFGDLSPPDGSAVGGLNTTTATSIGAHQVQSVGATGSSSSSSSSGAGLVHDARILAQDIARFQQQESLSGNKQSIANFMAECDLCDGKSILYKSPSALYAHLRTKHPLVDASETLKRLSNKAVVSHRCPQCDRVFATKSAMEAHFNEKHGVKSAAGQPIIRRSADSGGLPLALANPYWCHDCEKGFSTARALHGHLVGKHGVPTVMHPCPTCKRVFSDPFSLSEHVSQAHKTNKSAAVNDEFECEECGRCFLSKVERGRHIAKHHPLAAVATAAATTSGAASGEASLAHHTSAAAVPKKTAILRRRTDSSPPPSS